MKKYIALLFVYGIFWQFTLCQVVEIKETNKSPDEILDLSSDIIVDINSKLEVHLNQDNLLRKLGRSINTNPELISKLDNLNYVLANQAAILSLLTDSIVNAKQGDDIKLLGKYSVLMNDFYKRLTDHVELRTRANELYEEYFSLRSTLDRSVYPTPQVYVIKNMSIGVEEIMEQIQKSAELRKINIQLVAFLNTKSEYYRKVHIENYDYYSKGEFYEVKRWVTSFSDEDIKAFEQTQILADNLNEAVNDNLSGLENLLVDNFQSIDCFRSPLESIRILTDDSENLFSDNVEGVNSFLSEVHVELLSLFELITNFTQSNELGENINILELFNATRQQFIDEATTLLGKVSSLLGEFPNEIIQSNRSLSDLINSIQQCEVAVIEDIDKVKHIIQFTRNILTPFQNSANSVQEIGEEVFSFKINELPGCGFIELKTTGRRENGDELLVKLIVKTEDELENKKPGVTLEMYSLTLLQTKIYSVSKVSIIMASPFDYSEPVMLTNKFQFAPSGSLLFKSGSRKSKTWNFLDPGLGFIMSTPDFDLDGTPDVGIGGVVTILHDIVSLGISYNINTDNSFWFFGLSLPFTTPGLPINTIQTKN